MRLLRCKTSTRTARTLGLPQPICRRYAASMATLDERVARLERIEEDRQLDAALRAQAYGIGLVQSEVAEVRTDLAGLAAKVDANHAEVNGKLDAILERLDRG